MGDNNHSKNGGKPPGTDAATIHSFHDRTQAFGSIGQIDEIKARIIDANSRLMAMYRALAAGTSDADDRRHYLNQEQKILENMEDLLQSLEALENNSP